MPKDFAGRAKPKAKPRKSARTKTRQTASQTNTGFHRPRFHGPSFSFGALLGAAVVLAGLYAPEILQSNQVEQTADAPTQTSNNDRKPVTFEFPDLLVNSEVEAQPDAYPIPAQTTHQQSQFLIQAASFRSSGDADKLRAELILLNLPTYIEASDVNQNTWHRVYVGPFERKIEAERALTQLRQQRLAALLLEEHS